MSVASSIFGALRRFGRPMTLRRLTKGPNGTQVPLDVIVQGVTKGMTAEQLIGELQEGDTVVTITNTEIVEAQWPGPPRLNDRMVIDGKERTVVAPPEPKYLGKEVLVFEMVVRG